MFLKFKPFWKQPPLKSSYDAVIIGGGLHGLAAAYFLASRHGITDVAVIGEEVHRLRGGRPQHGHRARQPAHPGERPPLQGSPKPLGRS